MTQVLIVGAGPVGLAAAIELVRQGVKVRIIDKKSSREPFSKALAIHPHTLELFEPSKITETLLQAGIRITSACFHPVSGEPIKIDFSFVEHKYNFILVLPQYETENILEQALNQLGVEVEYNTELLSFSQSPEQITATIRDQDAYMADYLIGTDGAHSPVRHLANLDFDGKSYPNDWHIADLELAQDCNTAQIDLFMLPNNQLKIWIPIKPRLMRAISNHETVIQQSPADFSGSTIQWESVFKINCRQVNRYQKGRVFLAGDAAHIHSPAGGRGMNLGIADAMLLANKIAQNDLSAYSDERKKAGRGVIRMTDLLTRVLTGQGCFFRLYRDHVFRRILKKPFFQRILVKRMLGLSG